jgi:hypothetical protein
MSLGPRKFQVETVEAAVRALTQGSRRFLLADEVGLGKTVVAKEIIQKLATRSTEAFRVYYFGSGRTVTAQNAPRLMPDDSVIRANAQLCDASRPSLITLSTTPNKRLQIFQFTPGTAVPSMKGRGRTGVAIERALLRVLVSKVLRFRLPRTEGIRKAFIGAASEQGFARALRRARHEHSCGNLLRGFALTASFREAARDAFGAAASENLPQRLKEAAEDPKAFVATLRLALTRAVLCCMPPDLIIFDEFHRYRDQAFPLPGKDNGDDFMALLPAAARPATLLLSATPFRQSNVTIKGRETTADADDFHRLIGFLHGPGKRGRDVYDQARSLFSEFEKALAMTPIDRGRVGKVRENLQEKLLRPRMARTERAAFRPVAEDESPNVGSLPANTDLDLFVRYAAALKPPDIATAVAYWRSVPYPHQFLGNEYVAWRRAHKSKWRDLTGVTREQRNSLRMRADIPNMRFRELLKSLPPHQLALPWVPPSQCWWPLKGAWADHKQGRHLEKGLLFSEYRAAPRAIAGLVSFAVEDWAARQRGWRNWTKLNDRSFLSSKSLTVVSLFHPSSWLAQTVDPLAAAKFSRESLLRHAVRSIRESLPASVSFSQKSRLRRPIWQVLTMIESESKFPGHSDIWTHAMGKKSRGGQVKRALDKMDVDADETERVVSPTELRNLAWFGLSAPGVVLLRALRRNWPEATALENLRRVADLSWNGLRPYLDRPWFFARLMKGRRSKGYVDAIQNAVIDGNLESTLDEHFWLLGSDQESWTPTPQRSGRLASLKSTLGIRSAPIRVNLPGERSGAHLNLAAHAALPLTDTKAHTTADAGVEQLRADDLRRAFNTPFWPHLLCTTSVGQEGLDFHQWCRSVIHWDLCSNPVDVEQREGRVDRFKSLAVRRAIARNGVIPNSGDPLLWKALEVLADRQADVSDLAPWWIHKGAKIERWHFDPPSSEERAKRERLNRLRELYRLSLGLPHHRDILQKLAASDITLAEVRSYCLDLGAMRRL